MPAMEVLFRTNLGSIFSLCLNVMRRTMTTVCKLTTDTILNATATAKLNPITAWK